jgi:hypothetical protein
VVAVPAGAAPVASVQVLLRRLRARGAALT